MLTLTCAGLEDLDLEDPESGILGSVVDLGWPDPREAVAINPGQDGTDDQTEHHGSRAVSLALTITDGTIGQRAEVLARLTPFMHPKRRPVLRYVDDLGGANLGIREMTLAPRALNVARAGESITEAQAQFVAPSGVALDTSPVVLTLHPLAAPAGGIGFPLGFTIGWPASGSSAPLTVPVWGDTVPRVTALVYGPCTAPKLTATQNGETWTVLEALSSVSISAGDFLAIDVQAHTVTLNGSPGASRFEWIDHATSTWRLPMPGLVALRFTAASSSDPAQLVINARGAYFL
jgi:hypothetical protein